MTLSIHLGILEGAGLIQLASIQPELEYLFRHALVKDAAYFSLVKSDRRSVHRAVGETLQRLQAGAGAHVTVELYPLLAFHFAQAGDAAQAQRYFTLAGEAAAAAYANQEAAAHFRQAVEAASRAGALAADLIQLHTRLGRVQELGGDYPAALATYARLETLGRERGDEALAGECRRQARAEVEALAAQFIDPALRAGWLNRPAVRALLAAEPDTESAAR